MSNCSVKVFSHVLTDDQCQSLIDMIDANQDQADVRYSGISIPSNRILGLGEPLTVRELLAPYELETLRFSRMQRGDRHILHRDNQKLDGTPNHTPNRKAGLVIYLNQDFSGGELVFPDCGVEITPKTGLAVWMPGDVSHEVKSVFNGTRYAITAWAV